SPVQSGASTIAAPGRSPLSPRIDGSVVTSTVPVTSPSWTYTDPAGDPSGAPRARSVLPSASMSPAATPMPSHSTPDPASASQVVSASPTSSAPDNGPRNPYTPPR